MREPLDSASLRDLRSATDPALRATKATAQAIGRSMSSLIVLECHLWLTMMEMKEEDKVSFLDAPVSSGSLFGPAVKGFVYGSSRAHYSAQVSDHCDSGKNKTHTFSKREQKSFSAYHKHPALMQPVCTTA